MCGLTTTIVIVFTIQQKMKALMWFCGTQLALRDPQDPKCRYTSWQTLHDPHDGVAILVSSTLEHELLPSTWISQSFFAVKIHTLHGFIILFTTYAIPSAGIPPHDFHIIFNYTHIPVYLLADLNGRYGTFNHPTSNVDSLRWPPLPLYS